jgi:radical SAM superfamily enzyme YgiQ (UPF0313 family)
VKITFITPQVGRKSSKEYVRTWQMEPLNIATLAGLTPSDVEIAYYDERIERIQFDVPTDLAAITVETYTAKRAYEIAAEYHRRGVRTILGGYHATLIPDEAQGYADSILVGYAEPLWEQVVRDAERGTLQRRYTQNKAQPYEYGMPRREINWVGQGTLNMARDEKLLDIMAESGCAGVLIGFESLRHDTLKLMDKQLNVVMGDYQKLITRLHQHGIGLYGTFIFGYDSETSADTLRTAEAAIDFGLFIAAFNHLLPFPGTPLYEQFRQEGKLTDEQWWLSPTFRFGDVPFNPKNVTAQELHELCLKARQRFYSLPGIVRRSANIKGNATTLRKAAAFWGINALLRKEIGQKDGLPLGNLPVRPSPLYSESRS